MAQTGHGAVPYPSPHREARATGLELFASVMMILIGLFQMVVGLAAITRSTFYVIKPGLRLQLRPRGVGLAAPRTRDSGRADWHRAGGEAALGAGRRCERGRELPVHPLPADVVAADHRRRRRSDLGARRASAGTDTREPQQRRAVEGAREFSPARDRKTHGNA